MFKSTETRMDEVKMAKRIEELQERLEDMVKIGEQSINSLQASYENVLVEIINLRRQINETLDRLQEMTIRKLEQLHSDLKVSLENDSKQCVEFIYKLKGYDINRSENTSPERSFIIEIKCLDQTALADVFLRKQFKNADIEFQYNKELKTFLDSLTELGNITIHETIRCVNPNKVLIIKEKCQYKVRSATDTFTCFTTGICESVNGEIIIADRNNQYVKLLDPAFNLIEQLQLPLLPYSIFKISSNEMAVIIGNLTPVTQVHFIRVEKGTILKLNVIKLNHRCYGIACHQGDVFVTTPTAVCQYTIEGRLVKKLYEDKYGGFMGIMFFFIKTERNNLNQPNVC
ncbi:hypothetical protein DPMN_152906 [Dreissena polymorpha]|uniref:Uncharacterized protein n=1 Tax=Dreissena polymorpha TaxID=45954 RepID=A0A9D4FIB9_DREPO|nr:hypothetical protein DPMN_152906 [Dreissena polymorpha]